MTDHDGTPRRSLRRADLRRLREQLGESTSQTPELRLPEATPAPAPAAAGGTIMTVCTGNICRSPLGEVLLRRALRDVGVRVHSAGTHALVGHEMTAESQQLALANGADAGDVAAHRARLLTEGLLTETDLVLAMAREHRSFSVQLSPAVLHRTFTVREFARLAASLSDDDVRRGVVTAGSDAGARLRALGRLVGGQRGMVPPDPDNDDVIDPYRRSQQTYELSASQLVPAIDEVQRVVHAALTPAH